MLRTIKVLSSIRHFLKWIIGIFIRLRNYTFNFCNNAILLVYFYYFFTFYSLSCPFDVGLRARAHLHPCREKSITAKISIVPGHFNRRLCESAEIPALDFPHGRAYAEIFGRWMCNTGKSHTRKIASSMIKLRHKKCRINIRNQAVANIIYNELMYITNELSFIFYFLTVG